MKKKVKQFIILFIITIIDLLVLDPIPFLDEILLTGWISFLGLDLLLKGGKHGK